MRTKNLVYAALLSLGFVLPAWASPNTQPVPPAREVGASPGSLPMHEPGKKPVSPPVSPRGQMLYENHCMACHESVIHIRTKQRTQSLLALQGQVQYWAAYLQLSWGKEEINDVATHLNNRYYKFKSR